MKYRLVIFDFDGTLADSLPWYLQVVNTVADAYRFKRIEADEVETLRGYDARTLIKHLGIPWWKIPLIANHMHKLTATAGDNIALFEGADRLLHRLSQQGITLALVTSNSYAAVQRALGPETAALIQYYECRVPIFGKQRRFRKILKASGVSRSETLAIGDEIRDLDAARKARIPFGAAAWGFTHIEVLKALSPAETFIHIDEVFGKIVSQPGRA